MWVIWIEKRPYFYHISEKYLLSYDFHCLNSLVTYHPIIIGTKLRVLKKCFKVLLLHQDQTTTRSARSGSRFVVRVIFYLWCREAQWYANTLKYLTLSPP